jgi:hypothetical protein
VTAPEAHAHPRAALLAEFAGFPDRLEAAAVPASAAPSPGGGEWGVAEIVRHLIAVESEVHQRRQADVATLSDPQWTWAEPGRAPGYDDATLEQILAAFAAARAQTVATVNALDEAGWQRRGTHATYGVLDVAGLLRLAIDHDEDHLASIRALGV